MDDFTRRMEEYRRVSNLWHTAGPCVGAWEDEHVYTHPMYYDHWNYLNDFAGFGLTDRSFQPQRLFTVVWTNYNTKSIDVQVAKMPTQPPRQRWDSYQGRMWMEV